MPYIFSGSLTDKMVDYLLAIPQFEPMDMLVTQLDRGSITKAIERMDKGLIKSLFIDSGAYSVHSQGFEKVSAGRFNTFDEMVDEYIDYVNGIDDKIIAVAQFDHIPGVFKKAKRPEDFVESAELSWQNFLYMYPKMKSPEKLIAVFHQGESFEHLQNMLDWKDSNGNKLAYIGISPSNDRDVREKDVYLENVYDFIAKSSNPEVHTHLFGYTSLPGLKKFPWYSCDSVSHRLRAAYNKVFTNEWGVVSLSKTRSSSSKGDRCFVEMCDEINIKKFTDLVASYNFTVEQLQEDSAARTAVDILEVQKFIRENPYKPANLKKTRKLFTI